MTCALLALGFSFPEGAAWRWPRWRGGTEIACRLTAPHGAYQVRIMVLVIIVMVVTYLLGVGYSPLSAVPGVLLTALSLTWVARRLTGTRYKLPTISIAY
ncbi:hypothetical protein Hesp01_75470 [Herbidospora sp. NBRC 101105]|nr:hypothetical protein Hesp01_75470 [Herbidospora sp. NBRC 101105]